MMPFLPFTIRPMIIYEHGFCHYRLRGLSKRFNPITPLCPSYGELIHKAFYTSNASKPIAVLPPQHIQPSAAQILATDPVFINVDLGACRRFADIESVARNVKRRNMTIDIQRLYARYQQLQELLKEKLDLERQRSDNADIIKMLVKNSEKDGERVEEYKRKGKSIRARLKRLVEGPYRTLQESVTSEVLRLPVYLHRTVSESDEIIRQVGSPPSFEFNPSNHVTLTSGKDSQEFWPSSSSDGSYYLTGELSKLERRLVDGLSDSFLRGDLRKIVRPDMVKSFVTGACFGGGNDPYDAGYYSLEEKVSEEASLCLTGASVASFAAFLASQNVLAASLPLKYFSIGRSYSAKHQVESFGLFNVRQTTSVDLFAAAESEKHLDELFDEYTELVYSVYVRLNVPFKFVKVRCGDLSASESRRIDVYVWSAGYGRYFKCGSLGSHGDYISRRMTMKYAADIDDTSGLDFVYTLYGTVVKIPSIIAALVEQHQKQDGTYRVPPIRFSD